MAEHPEARGGQPGISLSVAAMAADVEDQPPETPHSDNFPVERPHVMDLPPEPSHGVELVGERPHFEEFSRAQPRWKDLFLERSHEEELSPGPSADPPGEANSGPHPERSRADVPWSITAIAERVETSRPFAAVAHHLEVPRPWRLLRTAAWSLGESIGLPFAAYLIANWAAGQTAGLISGLAAVWLTTVIRKAFTGAVPGLVMISAIMLTVQTVLVLATGETWIYLLQFPLAKFGLCLAFAKSAPTKKPLVAQLATEVVGLLHPSAHYPGLQRFFQRATWLWSVIFLSLACVMGVWVATEPITVFIFMSTIVTGAIVGAGICVSALWFWSVMRRLGLRLRFAPT